MSEAQGRYQNLQPCRAVGGLESRRTPMRLIVGSQNYWGLFDSWLGTGNRDSLMPDAVSWPEPEASPTTASSDATDPMLRTERPCRACPKGHERSVSGPWMPLPPLDEKVYR